MRFRQLPRPGAAAQARNGRVAVRRERVRARHHALLALMSIYGIELLADNVAECRASPARASSPTPSGSSDRRMDRRSLGRAEPQHRPRRRAVHDDAGPVPQPITFAEWSYLGKGKYHRRDFRFDTLTQMSAFGAEDTLFAELGKHEIFTPIRDHGT